MAKCFLKGDTLRADTFKGKEQGGVQSGDDLKNTKLETGVCGLLVLIQFAEDHIG